MRRAGCPALASPPQGRKPGPAQQPEWGHTEHHTKNLPAPTRLPPKTPLLRHQSTAPHSIRPPLFHTNRHPDKAEQHCQSACTRHHIDSCRAKNNVCHIGPSGLHKKASHRIKHPPRPAPEHGRLHWSQLLQLFLNLAQPRTGRLLHSTLPFLHHRQSQNSIGLLVYPPVWYA